MNSAFPTSAPTLHTAGPDEGRRLARRLADELLAALPPVPVSMPELLRTGTTARPDPAVVAAIYFHAISLANGGWQARRADARS